MTSLDNQSLIWLYTFQAISTATNRLYEFAAALFIANAFPNSLLFNSIYGFSQTLSAIIFGTFIGEWLDAQTRIKGLKTSHVYRYRT
ncbi:uncharacterized protein VTP21DRAFT_2281 [Calcarisporiella thermophila]|uniref:uncharacterized protein n=1 Tax=Calcarisporiella thermophila TaxID=911321 RepID=UPI003742E593